MAVQERPTSHATHHREPRAVRWVEWRCMQCGYYLASYDPSVPCNLHKVCPTCKVENYKDRRGDAA